MSQRRHGILKVGSVPYLVGRPLDRGLGDEPGIELSHAVPARLVEDLRAGRIDVALVSSIELFRAPGYRYLEGTAVCGRGFVGSVQIFLRRPIEAVERVALDPSSRTAATLVQVLLAARAGGPPAFVEVEAGRDPRALDACAWLRIGDVALRETVERATATTFNPSAVWAERTGLPFVFATWIVRPGVDIEPHLPAFLRARERGARSLGELASEAARAWGLPFEACARYLFEECTYDAGRDVHRALLAFRDGAAPLGLCEGGLEPEPVGGALLAPGARPR